MVANVNNLRDKNSIKNSTPISLYGFILEHDQMTIVAKTIVIDKPYVLLYLCILVS